MTNNPFEANYKKNNRNLGNTNQPSNSKAKIIAIIAVVFSLSLVAVIAAVLILISPISSSEEVINQELADFGIGELAIGEHIILNSKDLGECREVDLYEDNPCLAFNSNQHFKPGLYTVVYKPITYVPEGYYTTFGFHLNYKNYLGLDRPEENDVDYFSIFPDLENTFTVENVAMQEDAYIVLYNLDEDMEFTVELIPQTEYQAFKDNSGLLGFYPVGLAVDSGKYELDTEFSFFPTAEIVPVSYEGMSDDEQAELLKYDDDQVTLEENQILVSYSTYNQLV